MSISRLNKILANMFANIAAELQGIRSYNIVTTQEHVYNMEKLIKYLEKEWPSKSMIERLDYKTSCCNVLETAMEIDILPDFDINNRGVVEYAALAFGLKYNGIEGKCDSGFCFSPKWNQKLDIHLEMESLIERLKMAYRNDIPKNWNYNDLYPRYGTISRARAHLMGLTI